MKARLNCTDLTDFVYPRLAGSARARDIRANRRWRALAKDDERAVSQLKSEPERLEQYSAEVDKLLEREQSRKQSVDARLTSIVGLMSIAATIVLSGLVALAAGTLPVTPGPARWIFAIGSLYLVLQLFVALFAAISGLSRTTLLEDTAADLFASARSADGVRWRAQISRKLSKLRDRRRNADAKVDHMAVAHRAIKNFLVAMMLVAIAAAWVAVTWEPTTVAKQTEAGRIQPSPAQSINSVSPGPGGAFAESVAGGTLLPLATTAGGLALLAAGLVLLFAGRPVRNVALGAVLVTGGTMLSLLGGTKFELQLGKFDKLIGELQIRLFERGPVPTPTPGPPQTRVALARIATVGPFPDADHVLAADRVLRCLRDALGLDLTSRIGGWQIVGRVDKRPLRIEKAALYGSNQALAMSRAVWVRDRVLAQVPGFDVGSSVVSVGGAGQVGPRVGATELQSDRAVDIYVLVMQPVDKDGKTNVIPLKPAICP